MKNRYLIFSVLFWAIASLSMAITLPSSSYTGSSIQNDMWNNEFSIGSGISYSGVMLSVSNNDENGIECASTVENSNGTITCDDCCIDKMVSLYGPSWFMQHDVEYGDCFTTCDGWALADEQTPLGTPLCLLPFIAIYAVVRIRKENAEQA
jgi:hypothetical protein